MFFTTPESIDKFFIEVHKGQESVKKAYLKAELIEIAKNLGVSDAKGNKAILVERIFKRIGPGTEASLRNDLVVDKQEEKSDDAPKLIKTYTKPYDDCSLEEFKEEANLEGMLSTGSRNDIIVRLEALDSGIGKWEDCTTEFIREELTKHGYLSTGDRSTLIARIKECDGRFIGPAENKTSTWLKEYLKDGRRLTSGNRQELIKRVQRMQEVSYGVLADLNDDYLKQLLADKGLSIEGNRTELLLRLYPHEIDALWKKYTKSKKEAQRIPRTVYKSRYTPHRKKTSTLSHMVNGVALGAGLSLGAKIFGRRMKEESNLKF